ncbi:MAG: DegV family protein, partial [Clostridia bacterium]|nr:DegV family protein [Clostridia bacterium]
RLSNASAAVGALANIKPIVTVTADGRVEAVGKSIGCGRAMQFILDKMGECAVDDSFPVCSLYTYGEDNCAKLETKLIDAGYSISERLQIGSTIGTHVGPGVYGVVFVTKN